MLSAPKFASFVGALAFAAEVFSEDSYVSFPAIAFATELLPEALLPLAAGRDETVADAVANVFAAAVAVSVSAGLEIAEADVAVVEAEAAVLAGAYQSIERPSLAVAAATCSFAAA